MGLLDQKTLTVLGVKDHLKTALDKNLERLNKLDRASDLHNLQKGLLRVGKVALQVRAGIATGIGAGLTGATLRAKEFQSEFTQLENLNLDRSAKQIKNLEKQVLDSAFKVGANPLDTSKAFFDVQSGTGKFGKNVATIVESTSRFSTAVKSDFNTTLEGAIKGIKNFNLEAKDIDKFFASSAKTVQVGIVTFEQLAKVQTDYAGAANTSNQTVDSANKLFAVFTGKAKSAEEAATLTKSAFTDLLKPSTLQSFERIGVKVFDKQTGKVKQLDEIVAQLNEKFKPFRGNDRALNNLVNQFKGSEGLTALIGETAKNGDQMLKTFQQFDRTEFNLEKALRNSKADLNTMSNIVKNKLDVVLTKIGFKLVPKIVEGFDYLDTTILPGLEQKLPSILSALDKGIGAIGKTIETIGKAFTFIDRQVEKLDNHRVVGRKQNKANEDKLVREQGFPIEIRDANIKTKDFLARNFDPSIIGNESAIDKFLEKAGRAGALDDEDIQQIIARRLSGKSKLDDILGGADNLEKRLANIGGKKPGTSTIDDPATAPSGASGRLKEGIRGVTAGGDQVRNVTVNIQKQVGIENLHTTIIKEATAQVERAIREMMVKAVRDSEIALGQ